MRIGILTSSFPRFPGDGAGTFVQSLSETYARLGQHVEVIAPHDAKVHLSNTLVPVRRFRYSPDQLAIMGHGKALRADVSLRYVSYILAPLYAIAGTLELLRADATAKFDVIHAQWIMPSGLLASVTRTIRRLPFLVTAHGSDVYLIEKNPIVRQTSKAVLRYAEYVCAVSREMVGRLQPVGETRHPVQYIPYGVDSQRFHPAVGNGRHLRERLNINGDGKVLLVAGRLVYKKGFKFAIRALPAVLKENPSAVLVIGGAGDLRLELEKAALECGVERHVRFAGHLPWDQLSQYFCMADICLWPAVRDHDGNVDGLPVSLLEAMACGRPIIASRIAGIPDVIQHLENGYLVEAGNATELGCAINLMLSDEEARSRMGRRARETVLDDWTWESVARRYLRLMDGIPGR